ncbi:YegP family protein [Tenacibaculum ovolyticum]|uniref:YegP family protein n=1 Tax=Tenacibaculum ovolyticum TaxID=104270 RepID=UPI0007EE1643|nr:YegP family protein [Tenacibaculum ovolyticum]
MSKFIIKQIRNGLFYFNLRAENSEIILTSQGYTSKQGCINGINSVKMNATFDGSFMRMKSSNGKFYFNLKSQNGAVVGTSEMYCSSQSMENGVDAVKRDASNAIVAEQ